MKRVTTAHHTDRIGVHAVEQQVRENLGWLPRLQELDYGIDAIIEVVTEGQPTGKMIAAQIKSGLSYFKEANAVAVTFRGKPAHLDYWLNHDLPVIVILYEPKDRVAYWQSVTPEHATRTPKAWKMQIPRKQTLDSRHAASLEAIARQSEHIKAVASAFTCSYCGAELLERSGSEHLYEEFACGYQLLDGYHQCLCPHDPAFPNFEEYRLDSRECGSGPEKRWLSIPFPRTEAAKKVRLSPASGATKQQAEQAIRTQYDCCATKRQPHR